MNEHYYEFLWIVVYEKWRQSIYDRAYKYIDEKHPEYVRKDGGVLSLESIIDILLEDLGR